MFIAQYRGQKVVWMMVVEGENKVESKACRVDRRRFRERSVKGKPRGHDVVWAPTNPSCDHPSAGNRRNWPAHLPPHRHVAARELDG